MNKYKVTVEKRLYVSGVVEINAADQNDALDRAEEQIFTGNLKSSDVEWSEPQEEIGTFVVTGDVDE